MTEERLADMTLDELRAETRDRMSRIHSVFDRALAALEAWHWRIGEKSVGVGMVDMDAMMNPAPHERSCPRCRGRGHVYEFSEDEWDNLFDGTGCVYRFVPPRTVCPDCKGTCKAAGFIIREGCERKENNDESSKRQEF